MNTALRKTSTITAKGQTTVPEIVRRTLGVGAGDKIAFDIHNGAVTVSRVEVEAEDPALLAFLDLLERDIATPGRIQPLSATMWAEIDALIGDMEVDPDAPIDGPNSL